MERLAMRTKARPLALRAAPSLKRRKAIAASAVQEVIQIPYMKLRSRSLVMTHQMPRSSSSSRRRSLEVTGIEESIGLPPNLFDSNPECNTKSDSRDESKEEGITPPAAEIESFFAAAEREEQQLFEAKYNYDVVNDVPLNGRYEWVRLNP